MGILLTFQLLQKQFPEDCRCQAVIVSVDEQKLYLVNSSQDVRIYPVSTSQFGTGNLEGSFKTPLGAHRICEKIGDQAPIGAVFRGRQFTGEIFEKAGTGLCSNDDFILSRILWLEGLEEGINKGGDHDTYRRYIYIHGTHEENKLGHAASHGCIRMSNHDVIELFDAVNEDDFVFIQH